MTKQDRFSAAYNLFIADYVGRHGECASTRNEAHEIADKLVESAHEVTAICFKYAGHAELTSDAANDLFAALIDDNGDIDSKDDAKFLAAWAIEVALENLK